MTMKAVAAPVPSRRAGIFVRATLSTVLGLLAALWLALAPPVAADTAQECFGEDIERRILACTALLATPLTPAERSFAHAMRALSYSLKADYASALPDYDAAIDIDPDFAVARNNRAWAYYKSGRAAEGLPDAERALELNPTSPHTLDTRAHIRQALGDPDGALEDYLSAMRYGGTKIVRLYQCGLQANGLFDGFLDGVYTEKLRGALETCVRNSGCDPLPADEECRKLTS
ncbi:MAG: tetratricopeptide repeat protein [Hyphomicrobiaceae bacterium]|nr:tetratricopeptide repeat protein [Hyphomicrobiaceae bacterium]